MPGLIDCVTANCKQSHMIVNFIILLTKTFLSINDI